MTGESALTVFFEAIPPFVNEVGVDAQITGCLGEAVLFGSTDGFDFEFLGVGFSGSWTSLVEYLESQAEAASSSGSKRHECGSYGLKSAFLDEGTKRSLCSNG